ncbi:cyclic nucleotide-binding domain-containing protein, partial [Burkholderia pseudomallei]
MLQAQTQNAYTPAQQRVTVPLRAAKRDDAAKRTAARCSSCAMRSVCMPVDLNTHEFAKLDALICSTRQVKRGDTLFRTNDGFQSIYAVRTGSFKTVVMHRDGQEHVTGFQIVGETLGLDGVCAGHHNSDAV